MVEDVSNIKARVRDQLILIADPLVKSTLEKMLTEPIMHLREWDYSPNHEQFECWTIAIDSSTDTSLVYSAFGFGPKLPWGLASTSVPYFGMDSGWFDNLKDCFLESFAAGQLPIWTIQKNIGENEVELIGENLTIDEALEKLSNLAKDNKIYRVAPRKYDFA